MIRTILAIIIIIVCYGIAFTMIARVFLVAVTFNSSCPFVPSNLAMIKKILELFELKRGDKVVDIGSGDGRFLIYAARRYPEVKFYGVEQNAFLAKLSRMRAAFYRLKNVEIFNTLAEDHDFSEYNKVYMYMPDFFVKKIMATIEEKLPKGAKVINSQFGFGKEFEKTHNVKEIPFTILFKKSKISQWDK